MKQAIGRWLWWLQPNTFRSGRASVSSIDMFHVRYREGDRSMVIFEEPTEDAHIVAIDRSSMERWEPPHDQESVTDATRDEILENMGRAFASRGYRMRVIKT